VSETILIKDADKFLTSLSLLFKVIFSNPCVEQSHKFKALVVEWQVCVQELQGVRVAREPLALGFLDQALFQIWRQIRRYNVRGMCILLKSCQLSLMISDSIVS
jgi:hypothetical protein